MYHPAALLFMFRLCEGRWKTNFYFRPHLSVCIYLENHRKLDDMGIDMHSFRPSPLPIAWPTTHSSYSWCPNYRLLNIIKQFVVRNCSKERPGSIITKTLKKGILIPIVTPKASNFNANLKYVSFIKFSLIHQKLRAWQNLSFFRK